ncbi:bifunctional tRNA (adenosine(37)-N6)-threonylcarbamoyltransferase complex ATPase subunit type 1 TsaE/phosphotransferase, partial [Enterococcus hirae]
TRTIIQTITNNKKLNIPNPTFTLIQNYKTLHIPITHTNLYHISHNKKLNKLKLPKFLKNNIILAK